MTKTRNCMIFVVVLCMVLGLSVVGGAMQASFTPLTDEMLLNPDPADWVMWRRTFNGWGYSELDQINKGNVASLRMVWAAPMEPGVVEQVPLVYDGIMYLVQSHDVVQALDATTGDLIWEYRHDVPDGATYSDRKRNIALYQDKVYLATSDARLVALDARTGQVVWNHQVADYRQGYSYSNGPIVVKGKVVAGMSGCTSTTTLGGCFITAHDPQTGEELWRTYSIARPGDPANESWNGVPWENRFGGSVWMAGTYDPELDTLYYGTGMPSPYAAVLRGTGDGDVLYTNSTLALDPDTGEIKWYFQHIPNDEWDVDIPFERILVDTYVDPDKSELEWYNPNIEPGERKILLVSGKDGILWALDRVTGEFLWARRTVYNNIALDIDENGRMLTNKEIAGVPGRTVLACPRAASDYWPNAYSPQTNAVYLSLLNDCQGHTTLEDTSRSASGSRRTHEFSPEDPENLGWIQAYEAGTGKLLWEYRQRVPTNAALLTTAGGLLFAGDLNRRFRAFDAQTGEILWETIVTGRVTGMPITYAVDGKQYVAVPVGGGANYDAALNLIPDVRSPLGGNSILVFALPD